VGTVFCVVDMFIFGTSVDRFVSIMLFSVVGNCVGIWVGALLVSTLLLVGQLVSGGGDTTGQSLVVGTEDGESCDSCDRCIIQ